MNTTSNARHEPLPDADLADVAAATVFELARVNALLRRAVSVIHALRLERARLQDELQRVRDSIDSEARL